LKTKGKFREYLLKLQVETQTRHSNWCTQICVFDFTSGSGGNISLLLKHKFDFDITKELAHTNNLNLFRFEIRDFVITSQNCIGIEGQNSNNF